MLIFDAVTVEEKGKWPITESERERTAKKEYGIHSGNLNKGE